MPLSVDAGRKREKESRLSTLRSYASDTYVERRTAIADDAFARLDGLAAQNARRHVAIERSVETLDKILRSEVMSDNLRRRLWGLRVSLSDSNKGREGDDTPAAHVSRITPEMLGRPIKLEVVEEPTHESN